VAVRLRVPSTVVPGKELEYRLAVENVSRAAAHHVVVRAPVPTNARFVRATPPAALPPPPEKQVLSWQLGTLTPGARRDLVLVVVPDGVGDVEATARAQFEHGETVRTRIARPGLRVRHAGPARAGLHDPLTFRVDVTNTGAAPAEDVELSVELPAALLFLNSNPSTPGDGPTLTWKLGTLAPGQGKSVEYQVSPKEVGTFETRSVARSAGGLRQEAAARVSVGAAKLAVAISGPRGRSADEPATYRVTVANEGNAPAGRVQVLDDLFYDDKTHDHIELQSASDGGRLADRNVVWELGTLPPGARRTVHFTVRARREGTFTAVATARAERVPDARAECVTEFEPAAPLTLDLDRAPDPLPVGGQARYTYRVRNRGAAVNNLRLRVKVPDALKIVGATGPTAHTQGPEGVEFAPLPFLERGEVAYTVTVQADRPGDAAVRGELAAEPAASGGQLRREEKLTVVPDAPSKTQAAAP
jgi:uncharacterized repeat protein (TIGR01451 family)